MFQIVGPSTLRCGLSPDLRGIVESVKHIPAGVNFVEVEHRGYSGPGANLIRIGARNSHFRPLIESFATNGWFVYKSDGAMSTLVRAAAIPDLWHRIKNGEYSVDSRGTVYSINDENVVDKAISLVVVFSSMSLPFDAPGLSRYFEQNFSSINRHLGAGVVILRIADIDGVVGGFYSPTSFAPDRISRVQALIREVVNQYAISSGRVLLYGGSKGGSGALLHALRSSDGWRCVAVDPVVDDEYYETRYSDSHWTSGEVFLERKSDLFARAAEEYIAEPGSARIAIVTSPRSPLFGSVERLAAKIPPHSLLLASSNDPLIKDHPDVSGRTLRFVTGLLNVWSAGLKVPADRLAID